MKRDVMKWDAVKRDVVRRDGMKRDEMRRDEVKRDEVKRDEVKRDEMKRDEVKQDEMRRDVVKRDGMKRDMVKRDEVKRDEVKQDGMKRHVTGRLRACLRRGLSGAALFLALCAAVQPISCFTAYGAQSPFVGSGSLETEEEEAFGPALYEDSGDGAGVSDGDSGEESATFDDGTGASGGSEASGSTAETAAAVDGNRISQERLSDSVIEYEELGSLIRDNNLSVQEILKSTTELEEEYTMARDSLRTEQRDAYNDKKEAEDDGDAESYAEAASLEAAYKSGVKSYNDSIKNLKKYSSNRSRITVEKQLTKSAQSLMIAWQSLELQKEYLEALSQLKKAQYENTLLEREAGMATEQDVLSAYNSWKDAELSCSSLEDSQASIRQNLCLILGVDEENVEFQPIPDFDASSLETMDLETDTEKALTNNTDLISTKNTAASGGTSATNKKKRTIAQQEEQIRIGMQELYEEAKQALSSYQAASTGFESARLTWQNTESKYNLGMLSRAEYLQEKSRYLQKKLALDSAELELRSAAEAYQWGVKGILATE